MHPPHPSYSEHLGPGMAPMGGYSAPPGGLGVSVKYGLLFGLLAAVPNLLQVVIGVVTVNASQTDIATYQVEYAKYQDCLRAGGTSATCTAPPATGGVVAVLLAGYGTCCVAFLLTLVVYLFAGRAGARAAGRRGPGIWSAVVAALIGSFLYIIFNTVVASATGRSDLSLGMTSTSSAGVITFAVMATLVGMFVALICAALMGMWGAALGVPRIPLGWNAPPMAGAYGSMPPYAGYPGYPAYPPAPSAGPTASSYQPGYPPYGQGYPPAPGGYGPSASPDASTPPPYPPPDAR